MEYYAGLCGALFRAATRSNHFKELHVYYFHNCVYDKLYLAPSMQWGGGGAVSLDWVLRNYDSSYKLILVGDAAMHPYELTEPMYDWATRSYGPSGISCLERLKKQYPHLIWLNPNPMPQRRDYWVPDPLGSGQSVSHVRTDGGRTGGRNAAIDAKTLIFPGEHVKKCLFFCWLPTLWKQLSSC